MSSGDDADDDDDGGGSAASEASSQECSVRLRVSGLAEEVVADDQPTALYLAGKALRGCGRYAQALCFFEACQRALNVEILAAQRRNNGAPQAVASERRTFRSLARQLRECTLEAELVQQGVLIAAADVPDGAPHEEGSPPATPVHAKTAAASSRCRARRAGGASAPARLRGHTHSVVPKPTGPHRCVLIALVAACVVGCIALGAVGVDWLRSVRLLPLGQHGAPVGTPAALGD